jgi:hypothetical protein
MRGWVCGPVPQGTMRENQMIIAACVVLVLVSGAYVLAPLFREPKGNIEAELLAETPLDRLMGRKAVLLRNLKDLEHELKMGRLAEADYRRLESEYRSEASSIFQSLDELGVGEDFDEGLKRAVAERKARLFSASSARSPEAGQCPHCGAETVPGKNFCPDCGGRL